MGGAVKHQTKEFHSDRPRASTSLPIIVSTWDILQDYHNQSLFVQET